MLLLVLGTPSGKCDRYIHVTVALAIMHATLALHVRPLVPFETFTAGVHSWYLELSVTGLD